MTTNVRNGAVLLIFVVFILFENGLCIVNVLFTACSVAVYVMRLVQEFNPLCNSDYLTSWYCDLGVWCPLWMLSLWWHAWTLAMPLPSSRHVVSVKMNLLLALCFVLFFPMVQWQQCCCENELHQTPLHSGYKEGNIFCQQPIQSQLKEPSPLTCLTSSLNLF